MDGAAKVSTEISGLEKGKDYVAQIYVDNESDAKAWIKVTQGSEEVSNYTLKSIAQNYVQCDAHSTRAVAGSNMQRMLVPFVAKAATATLTLEREAGEGITYFDDIRIVEKHNYASFGFCLARPYWGRGYMTQALELIIELSFQKLGLHRMEGYHSPENPAVGRIMEKCGMVREGFTRQSALVKGEYRDEIIYGRVVTDPAPVI